MKIKGYNKIFEKFIYSLVTNLKMVWRAEKEDFRDFRKEGGKMIKRPNFGKD